LSGWRNGDASGSAGLCLVVARMESWEDILVTACRSPLDEMQGIIGVPNRPVVAEKSQDLQGEQALALKFLPKTWCEMRWLDQLRANAGSGVFVVEEYGAEQSITTSHGWL